jgi:SAM-dependent methyltransferase
MKLARSSFYYKPPSKTTEQLETQATLRDKIEAICLEFPGYGYRRVTKQLERDHLIVNHKKVLRLMRESDLLCRVKRKKVKTTNSKHHYHYHSNDANYAVSELFRVTRPGGLDVVATLNSLSPWATRRKARIDKGLFENAFFRSPDELLACTTFKGVAKTCIYFQKDDDPIQAIKIEQAGQFQGLNTGAFVATRWQKPL